MQGGEKITKIHVVIFFIDPENNVIDLKNNQLLFFSNTETDFIIVAACIWQSI